MKRVKVISAYCAGGGKDLMEGTVLEVGVDITESEANLKLRQGYVVEIDDDGEEVEKKDSGKSRGRRRGKQAGGDT